MRDGVVLVLPVEACRDLVVERECIPGEPSARSQRCRDALEGRSAVGPRRQMQERARNGQ
jgi:hypothetical protein